MILILAAAGTLLLLCCHPANCSQFYFLPPIYEQHSANGGASESAFIVGTQKISEFVGARNLQLSANSDALYFDSKVLYGYDIGCSQIYKIKLEHVNANAKLPAAPIERVERVTDGYGNAEHVAFFPDADSKYFLFSGFMGEHDDDAMISQDGKLNTNKSGNAGDDDKCGVKLLNQLGSSAESADWIYPNYELGEYLNPRNDIWLADSVTGEPLKRLTNADSFDGFPTVSHDSKTIYYTSMASGTGQLWAMNVNGSNKRQITFTENMLMLREKLSPDGLLLLSECIPIGTKNNDSSSNMHHLESNQLYHRTMSRICTTKLNEGSVKNGNDVGVSLVKFKARNGQSISIEALSRLTSPVFTPTRGGNAAQKFVFSAIHNSVRTVAGPQDHFVLPRGNTVLYMCNADGTDLEEIVDTRFKNNYPSFGNDGKRIAWISTEKIKTNPFTVYQYIDQIYFGNWMGERLLDNNNDTEGNDDLIRNIVLLKPNQENNKNASAIRPRIRNVSVGNGAISILYERVSTSGASQIRRLQLDKTDLDSFIVEELDPNQMWPDDLAISSPLEMASHATRLAPSIRETHKKLGLPSTSGDESQFIVYASSGRKSRRWRSKIMENDDCAISASTGLLPIANKFVYLPVDVDIYQYNSLGQMLRPLVKRRGFDGEPVAYVDRDLDSMQCRILFTSTWPVDTNGTNSTSSDDNKASFIDANLWLMDGCEPYFISDFNKLRGPKLLLSREGYDGEAAFAPDGNSIVFVGSVGNNDHNTDAVAVENLTKLAGENNSSVEAPSKRTCRDGSLVEKIDTTEIFILNINGTGLRELTQLGARSFAPVYMPDGKRVVFSSTFGIPSTVGEMGGSALYIINIDGTGLQRLTKSNLPGSVDAYADVVEYETSRQYTEEVEMNNKRRSLCLITWSSNRHTLMNGKKTAKMHNELGIYFGTMQC